MKKGLIGFLAACTLFQFAVVGHSQKVEAQTKSFVKVTSAPTDWSGTYLIVCEDGKVAFKGSLTTLDAANNNVPVNISDKVIEHTEALEKETFTFAKSSTSYTIQSASGYYIGNTADSNKLNSSTSTKYTSTVSLNSDGSVQIVGSGKSVLRYNANSGNYRFRYFKSSTYTSQKAITLYKLTEIIEDCDCTFEEVDNPQYLCSKATCTNAATYFKECKNCGKASDTDTFVYGEPLGHEYELGVCTRCGEIDSSKTPTERLNELFTSYHNEGYYVKDSVLNVNLDAKLEVAKYFHASQDVRYRKTIYTPDGLKMTSSEDGSTYSNESIYTNGDNCVIHTGFNGNFTVNQPSVEDWFVTLKDFKDSTIEGWTYSDGIYSHDLVETTATTEDTLTKMAREFVAPMWLAPNAENYNYVTFSKLTVEEVDNQLVMKLYVKEDNSGQLIEGSDLVFSQVTISKEKIALSTLATFEFGANGDATHSDGSDATEYSESNNDYTLSLASMTKIYKNARDAMGNSCIKLGTGSAAGGFAFTVPTNVNKVVINIAGYKAETAKVKINNVDYTITSLSNNGEYTQIEVDTSSTKTVSFTTVNGGYRCMINSIEYHK